MSLSSLTQLPGIFAGHATDKEGGTGCTVVVCPKGAVGAVDVRGGAPATRETDLLRPEETVEEVHAVILAGGSAFGLAASCGVANELERRDIGVDVGVTRVPIVCGACLFDLAYGDVHARPTLQMGEQAVRDAFAHGTDPLERGSVGAGTGCTVGKATGMENATKTGLGEGVCSAGDLVCAAISAVNALGDVVDPKTGATLAGHQSLEGLTTEDVMLTLGSEQLIRRGNTTISCIVTNASLTKAQATKVAQIAADAYAHTIRPTHTTNDGDAIFVLATGEVTQVNVDVCGLVATHALERAIVDAALSARVSESTLCP